MNKCFDVHSLTSELLFYLGCTRAVLNSFAGEYVDVDDDRMKSAIATNSDDYRNLFNALCVMLQTTEQKAEELEAAALDAMREPESVAGKIDKAISKALSE